MSSSSSNSSPAKAHEGNLVCLQNPTETQVCEHPGSPKSFIQEIRTETKGSEAPVETFSGSPKRTAEQAGLSTALSEAVGGDSPKKSRSVIFEEESNFAKLFDAALRLLKEYKNLQDHDISKGVWMIVESFRSNKGNQFSDVDFEQPENLCGYLCRYGPCAAGLTRHRILEALRSCNELQSRLRVPSIKIISLGTGPGCDVIGLCSALYQYVKYRKVKLTLVDKYKGWVSIFNVIEFLTRNGEYGNASDMFQNSDVSTTFLRQDLTDCTEQDETYFSALKEADVILLNKVFSILPDDKKEPTAQKIVGAMKSGAILLFINSSNYRFSDLQLIYSNSTYEEYDFQGEAISSSIAVTSKAQIYVYQKRMPIKL